MDAKMRIRQLMEERGWTEYRLAKEAGLAQTTISNLFRRNNAPSLSTVEAICKAFDISLAQFFSDDNTTVEISMEQYRAFNEWMSLTKKQKEAVLELIKMIK